MKTILKIQKNILSKLTRVLMFGAVIFFGFKANAQCTALFTSADSAGTTYFSNLSTGSGLTSTWDFGDGTVFSTSGDANYTYASPGTYYVCLSVTDFLGTCTATYCDSVVIVYGATGFCSGSVDASFVAGDSACYGYFYNNPTAGGSGQVYFWDYGDGTTGSAVGTNLHLYPANGTYYVCLTVTDGIDSCQYCNYVTIASCSSSGGSGSCLGIVDPTFSYIDSAGYGVFTNTPSGSGQSYFWNFGDGSGSSTIGSTSHPYANNGTYYVCLNVYSASDSCQYCTSVTINSVSTCNPFFYTIPTFGGAIAFYNASSGTGTTTNYFWDFGDGTTSTMQSPPAHNYATAGTYIICLTISDTLVPCSATYCDTINISGCTANISYTPDAVGNGCTFYSSSTGTGDTYFWDFGDGTTSTLQNPYHIFPANGYYSVMLTVTSSTDTSCSSTDYEWIYMSGVCDAYFYTVQDSTNLYNYFVYNYSSTTPGTTYLWDFGDGTTSTAAYPSHTYASTAPVVLCLTIADSSGCTDTYCDSITPGMIMSSVFTINVVPLGVTEQVSAISSLENYPNPFSDNTTINYAINKNAHVSVSIMDLLGNTIAELENENKTSGEYSTTWNAENVSEGMYLLQLKVNNDISVKKIIVNR